MLFLLPSLGLSILYFQGSKLPLPYWSAIASLVLYPALLWGIGSTPPKKLGLSPAALFGSVWCVFSTYYAAAFAASLFGGDRVLSTDIVFVLGGLSFVLALLLAAYTRVAWKLGRSMASGRGDRRRLAGAVAGGALWGVLAIVATRTIFLVIPGQAPAVGMLRTINTAEITYASTYERGYTSSLAEFAPPPRGMQPSAAASGMIDSALASGMARFSNYRVVDDIVDELDAALGREPSHAYRLEYQPGPRDEKGAINSYTVCARSAGRVRNANSYFTNETGVIWTTSEDRCPTPKDWPVAG